MVHMYKGILLGHQKEPHNGICSNIDGPGYYHTERRKSEKDKCHIILLKCWFLKYYTNEPIYKKKRSIVTDLENKLKVTKGE